MKLLLDTNALIWTLVRPERLTDTAREEIRSRRNRVYVSAVSALEIGILRTKKRMRVPADLDLQMATNDFEPLAVAIGHALAVESLPAIHADPFDRILIAQAQIEGMTIVTSDRVMRRYPVATMPATS